MFARPRVEPQPRERNPRERCQELHMTPLICDPTGADLDEVAVGELMNLGFDFNLQRSPRVTRLRSGEEVHSRIVDLAFSGPVLAPATSTDPSRSHRDHRGSSLRLDAETGGTHAVQVLAPEVRLRGEGVVRRAAKLQVVRRVRSPERVGVSMMQLEASGLAAPDAPVVDVRAPAAVTRPHRAPDPPRDVTPLGVATARR